MRGYLRWALKKVAFRHGIMEEREFHIRGRMNELMLSGNVGALARTGQGEGQAESSGDCGEATWKGGLANREGLSGNILGSD